MKGTCMADKLGSLQLSPCCWPLILVPPAVLLFLLVVVLLLNIVVCWWWSQFVNFLSISPLFRVCFPNEWTTDTGINLWRRSGWTFPSASILTVPRRESRSCSFTCSSCSSLSFNNSWTWVSLRLNIQPIDNISSCTICPLTCYRYLVVGGGWRWGRKLTLSNHSDSLPCECLSPKLNLNPKGRVYKITLLLPLHYSLSTTHNHWTPSLLL